MAPRDYYFQVSHREPGETFSRRSDCDTLDDVARKMYEIFIRNPRSELCIKRIYNCDTQQEED
jgi:hypothetical protein